MGKNKNEQNLGIGETLPHQINAPNFQEAGMRLQPPFVNSHGVTIGDSYYTSPNSPLEQWSKDTDPSIMAGEEWVHPTNDIGWNTPENRRLIEKNEKPRAYPFMHPTKDVSHGRD